MIKLFFFSIYSYSLFDPKSKIPIGGSEVQLFLISRELAKNNDFKVFFATGDFGQPSVENHNGIKVYKSLVLEKKILNYFLAPIKIWKIIGKINADIYIASSAGVEIGIIAIFCKIKRKKFIFRTASSIDCTMEKIEKLGFLKGLFYKYGLRNADVVIVQNKQGKEDLLKYHKKDSIIIKNTFSVENANISDKEYILWVGSARRIKRPELFLKVVESFPEEKFVMIMPKSSDENFWNIIYGRAKKMNNLKFIEKVPFGDIQEYFNKARILVGTSEYEGFPNVYLQACLGKTPIVSLSVNPDDFINKNNLGCFSEDNFNLMTRQISKLLNDSTFYSEKSMNAFTYIYQNHDINKIIKQWKEVIFSQIYKEH